MQTDPPPSPPSFESEEELAQLLLDGLESGEGILMTPEEWQRLRQDLEQPRFLRKLAS